MNPIKRGRFGLRLTGGLFAFALLASPMPGNAVVPRQGWTPASFGLLSECGKEKPPTGYLFPGAGCLYTTRIKFSASVPGLAYVGTLGHGLWMSAGGESWTPVAPQCLSSLRTIDNVSASTATGKDGLATCGIEDFSLDPQDPKTIYVAAMEIAGIGLNTFHFDPGGVFKSDDGGTTWSNIAKSVPDLRAVSLAVIHEPGRKAVLMAGNIQHADHDVGINRSLAISYDDGASWHAVLFKTAKGCRGDDVSSSPKLVAALAPHPTDPNVVFAGSNGGLYVTRNQGRTWSLALAHCVSDKKVSVGSIWAIAYSPDGRYVYAGLWDGTIRVALVARPTQWRTIARVPGAFLSSILVDRRDPLGRTLYVTATGAQPGAGRNAAGVYKLVQTQTGTSVGLLQDSWLAGPNHYLGPVPLRPYELVKTAPGLALAQSSLDPDMLFLSEVAGGVYWRSEGEPGPNPTAPPTVKPTATGLPTALPSVAPLPPVHTGIPTAIPSPTITPTH